MELHRHEPRVVRDLDHLGQLGARLAAEGQQADLIVGNNVFAHVPDINDFTRGLKAALRAGGTITLEFPHLQRLIGETQFDTLGCVKCHIPVLDSSRGPVEAYTDLLIHDMGPDLVDYANRYLEDARWELQQQGE